MHSLRLHVHIEKAVRVCDTGLIQALATVAMLVHAAFSPVEWRLRPGSSMGLASDPV